MNWIASLLIIVGYLLIIGKYRSGFILQILGCFIYFVNYINLDFSIVLINGVFILANIFGLVEWSKTNE